MIRKKNTLGCVMAAAVLGTTVIFANRAMKKYGQKPLETHMDLWRMADYAFNKFFPAEKEGEESADF